ncbi:sarcosine oxidase subunit delta [Ralstonia syzygii]|uniref:Putative sarcosine oxidase (Delta subunit) oxidoreductase protein n=1 Tax=Ralstonia syzygii R24 TaxID=907261 RepID=G3A4C5_9RALS|nr:sarcosine oxidase subunit delta [Ralstonia syzygii]CCA88757.1 putative sarcosine oxidase (Delta subunit) oxidoreductase protein [Ralstonia syzygii R24]
MLRIKCPFCNGVRDEEEFTFGGPFERQRPSRPAELNDQEWSTYLFTRDNVRGLTLERWRHTFGCRQWFGIERHTENHAITRTFRLDELPREHQNTASTVRLGEKTNETA